MYIGSYGLWIAHIWYRHRRNTYQYNNRGERAARNFRIVRVLTGPIGSGPDGSQFDRACLDRTFKSNFRAKKKRPDHLYSCKIVRAFPEARVFIRSDRIWTGHISTWSVLFGSAFSKRESDRIGLGRISKKRMPAHL